MACHLTVIMVVEEVRILITTIVVLYKACRNLSRTNAFFAWLFYLDRSPQAGTMEADKDELAEAVEAAATVSPPRAAHLGKSCHSSIPTTETND